MFDVASERMFSVKKKLVGTTGAKLEKEKRTVGKWSVHWGGQSHEHGAVFSERVWSRCIVCVIGQQQSVVWQCAADPDKSPYRFS